MNGYVHMADLVKDCVSDLNITKPNVLKKGNRTIMYIKDRHGP